MLKIPAIVGAYAYDQNIALEDSRWILRLAWSDRNEAWYLSIREETEEAWALTGARVNPEWPITIAGAASAGLSGAFVALSGTYSETHSVNLNVNTLGREWWLYYFTRAELDAFAMKGIDEEWLEVRRYYPGVHA